MSLTNTPDWESYYERVLQAPHARVTETAAAALAPHLPRTALDCGCGTGRDSAWLLGQGFRVCGFDREPAAIRICQQRFPNTAADFSCCSFEEAVYGEVSLILAHASLFFCEPREFAGVWQQITAALPAGGVFSGDFLGRKDSWVNSPAHRVSVLDERELRSLFAGFEILAWHERDEQAPTVLGKLKHWHCYSVLARKLAA